MRKQENEEEDGIKEGDDTGAREGGEKQRPFTWLFHLKGPSAYSL